jgi:hypothetical protein
MALTHVKRHLQARQSTIPSMCVLKTLWDPLYIVYIANIYLYEGLRLWECPDLTKTLIRPCVRDLLCFPSSLSKRTLAKWHPGDSYQWTIYDTFIFSHECQRLFSQHHLCKRQQCLGRLLLYPSIKRSFSRYGNGTESEVAYYLRNIQFDFHPDDRFFWLRLCFFQLVDTNNFRLTTSSHLPRQGNS